MKPIRAIFRFIQNAWVFLSFLVYFGCAWIVKAWLCRHGFELPRFAHWEIAALCHVFHFAWDMMDFKGFMFVSRKFNTLTKKLVLVIAGLLLFTKVVIIIVETNQIDPVHGRRSPLIEFSDRAKPVEGFVDFSARYIMVAPLILFAAVNSIVLYRVRREGAKLGLSNTPQEQYLKHIRKWVDVPPILIFGILLMIFQFDPSFEKDRALIIGVLCVSALTLSNLLAAYHVKGGELNR